MKIDHLREDYGGTALRRAHLLEDPVEQFRLWFRQALDAEVPEANAMTLATATAGGRPSVRTVLLKGCDEAGFVFYTNYESRKAAELAANPHAALLFFWQPLKRQVRVEGKVERVSRDEAGAYFQSRPRGSRLGAWASPQSRPLADRGELQRRLAEMEKRYEGGEVPLPPFWGGYRLAPEEMEFWQGRSDRLHDRFRYRRDGGVWTVERLGP